MNSFFSLNYSSNIFIPEISLSFKYFQSNKLLTLCDSKTSLYLLILSIVGNTLLKFPLFMLSSWLSSRTRMSSAPRICKNSDALRSLFYKAAFWQRLFTGSWNLGPSGIPRFLLFLLKGLIPSILVISVI